MYRLCLEITELCLAVCFPIVCCNLTQSYFWNRYLLIYGTVLFHVVVRCIFCHIKQVINMTASSHIYTGMCTDCCRRC